MSYATENSWLLRYDVSLGGGSFCFKGSQFLFFFQGQGIQVHWDRW